MKLSWLLLALLPHTLLFSQESAEQEISKLSRQKEQLKNIIQVYEDSITSIDSKIQELRANRLKEEVIDGVEAEVKSTRANVYNERKLNEVIGELTKGQQVIVIGYTDEKWKIVWDNGYGLTRAYLTGKNLEEYKWLEQARQDSIAKAERQHYREIAAEKQKQEELEKLRLAEERTKSLIAKYGNATAVNILNGKIWIGMTKEMLADSWGLPSDINRTVTAGKVSEQWVYGTGEYVYLDNGIVTAWQD